MRIQSAEFSLKHETRPKHETAAVQHLKHVAPTTAPVSHGSHPEIELFNSDIPNKAGTDNTF